MKRSLPILLALGVVVVAGLVYLATRGGLGPSTASGGSANEQSLASPTENDWPMNRRTYGAQGYSPLKQITPENVGQLEFVWSSVVAPGPVQLEPLVYAGKLYLPQPGDIIEAFDAESGDRLWQYARELPKDIDASPSSVPRTARNIAIWQDKLYHASADGFVIALETETGKLAWETQVVDYKQAAQVSGPLIIKGKVITGRACEAALPEGCFIVAHDAADGTELWRRSLMPEAGSPEAATWGDAKQQLGAWLTGSYDPELDLMFWGTSTAQPLPAQAGEMAYSNATFAIKPDTGEVVWRFAHLPGDVWGMDHAYERMVLSTEGAAGESVRWRGAKAGDTAARKVLSGVMGKTGLLWTLDAASGEFLWAKETMPQNLIQELDSSGKPTLNPATALTEGQTVRVCPSGLGGKHWGTSSYNPEADLLVVPLANACMEQSLSGGSRQTKLVAAEQNPGQIGVVEALSPTTGQTAWTYRQEAPVASTLSTGGGLVFVGDLNRRFKALNSQNGEVVWETVMSAPVTGTPISYAVNGKQYIAVATGGGTDLEGLLALTPELRPGSGGNALFVYALPEENP